MNSRLRSLFEKNYQPIILVDRRYRIVESNEAALLWVSSVHGVSIRKGNSVLEYLAREDIEEFTAVFNDILFGRKDRHLMFSVTAGLDSEFWFEYHLYPVSHKGRVEYVYLVVGDITERKNAIDEVARNARRYQSMIKNSTDIIGIIREDGTIGFISDSVMQVLGYRPAELEGRNFLDYVFHEDEARISARLKAAIDSSDQAFEFRFRIRHKDEFWVFIEAMGTNLIHERSVGGIVLNMRDVTERMHIESMLVKINRQNELILESAGEGIYGINTHGMITFANPAAARMLGFKVEEMIGQNHRNILQLLPPADEAFPGIPAPGYGRDPSGGLNSAQFVLKRLDGTIFPAECVVSPINEKGTVVGAVVAFKDITDRVQAEEALRRSRDEADAANRAKSEFLANISHEIRTPITSIIGFLDLLEDSRLDRSQTEYIRISRHSAQTLLDIINDILDFSKIEERKIEISPHEFNPMIAFESSVELLSARARGKRVDLHAFIDPRLPFLIGDELRIKQVLNNLIGNSVKFTPAGGTIFVEIVGGEGSAGSCRVRFSVKDSGIGIPQDKQEMIFESFTQADSSIAREYGGTGLGLAISSNLVKMMGGKLDLESAVGKGSCFSFMLELPIGETRKRNSKPDTSEIRAAIYSPPGRDQAREQIFERYLRAMEIPAAVVSSFHELEAMGRCDLAVASIMALDRESRRKLGSLDFPLVLTGEEPERAEAEEVDADVFIPYPVTATKIEEALRILRLGPAENEVAGTGLKNPSKINARILLAEDTPANQLLMRRMLEKLGSTVTLAENGEEAVELWTKGTYDAVLMDVNMPVCDGVEATRRIRHMEKENALPRTRIIALTARALKGDEESLIAAGMDGYLSKPVSLASILDVLKTALPGAADRMGGGDDTGETARTAADLGIDEESLLELVEEFLGSWEDYVPPLRRLALENEFAEMRFLAHRLKGASANFRLHRLAEIAGEIESASAARETADYTGMANQVETEFARLRRHYRVN
ncbi:MAG: PAS domain S-box protein [Spirochaetes bacterium]|nr:MAG: PAS domain S-box protein [Spirochaetota bacterium]